MEAVVLASAVVIGCLLAVQAAANLQLTKAVGTPYGAATMQLWVAAALLAVLAVLVGGVGAVIGVVDVPPWYLLGGLASPLYITSGILLFPRMGALAAGGLFVTGQMGASVALDLSGALGVPRQPLGPGIVAGTLAVLTGITLVVRAQLVPAVPATCGGPARVEAPPTVDVGPAWVLLGLVAGAVLPLRARSTASSVRRCSSR